MTISFLRRIMSHKLVNYDSSPSCPLCTLRIKKFSSEVGTNTGENLIYYQWHLSSWKSPAVCQECLADRQNKELTFPWAIISVCSNRDFCTNTLIACMRFVHESKIFSFTSSLIPESAALDLLNISWQGTDMNSHRLKKYLWW